MAPARFAVALSLMLCTLAATADLPGATYVGPSGPGVGAGPPHVVGTSRLARDETAQRRLWEVSEETVGLTWPAMPGAYA